MTILPLHARGLAEIAAALHDQEAVAIPFPSPLPYAVAATEASVVNRAKGRPSDQPCGILLSSAHDLAPHLDLDAATVALSIWIADVEQANLLVPLLPDAPGWLSRASVNGLAGITLAWLAETRPLADKFRHLFVSSANQTTGPVGVTAPEADDIFRGRQLVLDGDPFRDTGTPHASATIIEVRPQRRLHVVRDGINNRSHTGDHAAYLQALHDRFAMSSSSICAR